MEQANRSADCITRTTYERNGKFWNAEGLWSPSQTYVASHRTKPIMIGHVAVSDNYTGLLYAC